MSHKVSATLACAMLALALGGCGSKTPTGQVVATVGDQEVTLQEVNAELAGAQTPPNVDRKDIQRQALQRVIDRKLFAGEARTRELDKTPEYISQRMRLDETLLAQQLIRQQAATLGQPTPADINAFKAENPNIFGQRRQLLVDQIRFQPPGDMSVLKSLESAHSQDQVAVALRQKNVQFARGRSTIDTAVLPNEIVRKIEALPAGEPFVLPARGVITINVVTGESAAPLTAEQATQAASNGWREKRFSTMISDRLAQLKKSANITYQPGYAPAATPGAGSGAAPGAGAAPAR